MEEIFSDLNKDAALQENYANIDCLDSEGFKRYAGVKNLKDRSGLKSIKFRNETDYDLLGYDYGLFVDPQSQGVSMVLKIGSTFPSGIELTSLLIYLNVKTIKTQNKTGNSKNN